MIGECRSTCLVVITPAIIASTSWQDGDSNRRANRETGLAESPRLPIPDARPADGISLAVATESALARVIFRKGPHMRFVSSSAVSLLLLAACSHAHPAPIAAPASPPFVDESAPAPPPEPRLPTEPLAVPIAPDVEPVSLFFEYDASELTGSSRTALQSFFDRVQAKPDQDVRIEGNCDERGSTEYNLALGQRRAEAAKKYLQDLGMAAALITAVSNGKERPVAVGHEEAARRQNRRDDLIPLSSSVAVSDSEAVASRGWR